MMPMSAVERHVIVAYCHAAAERMVGVVLRDAAVRRVWVDIRVEVREKAWEERRNKSCNGK